MMEPNVVATAEGAQWFVCGWRLFARNAGIQIAYGIIFLLIAVVLPFIPWIGALTLALISPVLLGGWYLAADKAHAAEPIELSMFFSGFQDKAKTAPLLTLGAIMVGGQILLQLFSAALIGGSLMHQMPDDPLTNLVPGQVALGFGPLLALLVVLTVAFGFFMALFYAVPLVTLKGAKPLYALQSSFSASLKNMLPLLAFSLIYAVLTIIAAIPVLLGFIVLVPVSICAAYCSFQSIYAGDHHRSTTGSTISRPDE